MRRIEPPFIGAPAVPLMAVDDVWLREPNLLTPGKAPIGPFRIDWENPLARKLAGYVRANDPTYYNQRNGQRQRMPTQNTPKIKGTEYGPGMMGGGFTTLSSTPVTWNPLPYVAGGGFTFMGVCKFLSSTPSINQSIYASRANETNAQRVYADWFPVNSGNISWSMGSSKDLVGTIVPTPGEITTVAHRVKWNSSNNVAFWGYINGVLDYSIGGTTYDATTALPRELSFGQWVSGNPPTDYVIYMLFIWDRPLDLDEIRILTADPYQFLIPA